MRSCVDISSMGLNVGFVDLIDLLVLPNVDLVGWPHLHFVFWFEVGWTAVGLTVSCHCGSIRCRSARH